ncbi:MAG: SusD/RagB family nutrient-binding outer membrane lipoprotein [Ferruginibacter sp.]
MKSLILFLCFTGVFICSCDKGFVEVNTNPVQATSLDPAYLLTTTQLGAMFYTLQYQDPIVQQMNTPFGSSLEGGQHNIWFQPGDGQSVFTGIYANCIKALVDIIARTQGDPGRANLYNMARIWKAYCFQVLADTYGDVPYSQAGQAYLNAQFLPQYDPAETIYDDLLKELSEATAALDPAGLVEKNDLFYAGSISQWKRLGYSILLRVAMRLTKVDVAKAQQFATVAINGGLMTSNADNAKLKLSTAYPNINGNSFNGTERANYYIGKPFIDLLKSTNDPRLKVIAVKYEFPANDLATAGNKDTDPANQIGEPYGYNDATISTEPNYPGKSGAAWKYSQVNRQTLGKFDGPYFFVTYSQTELLHAEAVQRGWAAGSVSDLYNMGVKAHMDQMAQFDVSATIAASDQDAYLVANPFNPAKALEQINTQYWISCFLYGQEGWSNFRRSGFPLLTPNPYPGADPLVKGGFIRRLQLQSSERSVNKANVEAAWPLNADNLATRIFWDN